MGMFGRADGSGYWEQGNTKVLAAVYGPREASKRDALHDRAALVCEYQVATFSGGRRGANKQDRQATEVASFVRQTFESVLLLDLYPGSVIHLYVTVLQADGGRRAAAVNAATLALADAGIPMRDLPCACSVGFLESTPLLDMNQAEEMAGGPVVPYVGLPGKRQVVSAQLDNKLPLQYLAPTLEVAHVGATAIHRLISSTLKAHFFKNQPMIESK